MDPSRIPVLVVLAFSLYVGWTYLSGRRGRIPIYAMALTVAVSLVCGAVAQLLHAGLLVEVLNLATISLSLAALASTPALWEVELRRDYDRTRLYQAVTSRDFASWAGWLKIADRVGGAKAALCYVAVFGVGTALQLLAWGLTDPAQELFVLLALLAPLLFAVLSSAWLYRAVRRVMPRA